MPHTIANQPAADQKMEETEVPQSQSSVAGQSAAEQGGYDRTEPEMGPIALWGLLIIVSLIAVILGVQAYFDGVTQSRIFTRVVQPLAEDLQEIQAKENARLHSYQWVDSEAGVVRLPIDRGMELLAAEFAAGKLSYSTEPVLVKKPDLEPRP